MSAEITYNPRFGQPTPEVWAKILWSQEEAEELPERELKCPICGFPVAKVFSHSGYVDVKCRKCKFAGVLNLAYFRRQKANRRSYSSCR